MKLHLAGPSGKNAFTGYGAGYVMVNRVRHEKSLVVLPDEVIADWNVPGFDALAREHFEFLAGLAPEILLLGTGERLRFPDPALLQPLAQAQVGLEVMDTNAACRTFNILMGEDRKVVAALILG